MQDSIKCVAVAYRNSTRVCRKGDQNQGLPNLKFPYHTDNTCGGVFFSATTKSWLDNYIVRSSLSYAIVEI